MNKTKYGGYYKMETEEEFNKRVSRFVQLGLMMGGNMPVDYITCIEVNWYESFALLPHKTIAGKWVWFRKIFKRRVWKCTGFADEPFTEYGELFDLL